MSADFAFWLMIFGAWLMVFGSLMTLVGLIGLFWARERPFVKRRPF